MMVPWYRQEEEIDHLYQDWQGFKVDDSQVEPGQIIIRRRNVWEEEKPGKESLTGMDKFLYRDDYISMKINTIIDPKFIFVEVPEFINQNKDGLEEHLI